MSQVCLISGSPGCGKTNWILDTFKNYSGNCGYLRLGGYSEIKLSGLILNYLKNKVVSKA